MPQKTELEQVRFPAWIIGGGAKDKRKVAVTIIITIILIGIFATLWIYVSYCFDA